MQSLQQLCDAARGRRATDDENTAGSGWRRAWYMKPSHWRTSPNQPSKTAETPSRKVGWTKIAPCIKAEITTPPNPQKTPKRCLLIFLPTTEKEVISQSRSGHAVTGYPGPVGDAGKTKHETNDAPSAGIGNATPPRPNRCLSM